MLPVAPLAAQDETLLLHVCHLNVNEIGCVPVQVPVVAVSVWPASARPEIVGGAFSLGAPGPFGISAVAFVRTVVLPSLFDAVTSSRIV